MTPDLVGAALGALAADPALVARARGDVAAVLGETGPAPLQAPAAPAPLDLRRLPGGADRRPVWMAPTDGSQCTQAGCYTREARCSSQYACSRTGGC